MERAKIFHGKMAGLPGPSGRDLIKLVLCCPRGLQFQRPNLCGEDRKITGFPERAKPPSVYAVPLQSLPSPHLCVGRSIARRESGSGLLCPKSE